MNEPHTATVELQTLAIKQQTNKGRIVQIRIRLNVEIYSQQRYLVRVEANKFTRGI